MQSPFRHRPEKIACRCLAAFSALNHRISSLLLINVNCIGACIFRYVLSKKVNCCDDRWDHSLRSVRDRPKSEGNSDIHITGLNHTTSQHLLLYPDHKANHIYYTHQKVGGNIPELDKAMYDSSELLALFVSYPSYLIWMIEISSSLWPIVNSIKSQ